MKKVFLSSIALFLFYAITNAQETNTEKLPRNFIAVTAGPSFPIGDFGSTSLDNTSAGMAKTGFNLQLKYGYRLSDAFGLSLSGLYGHYAVDKKLTEAGHTVGPWEYAGALIGPFITTSVSPSIDLDLNVMTGAVYTILRDKAAQDEWRVAVPARANADLRFALNKSVFISAGADYLYMRPKFKTSVSDGNTTRHRTISTVGVNAGVGLTF